MRAARELELRWSDSAPLIGHAALVDWARSGPFVAEEVIASKGDAQRVAGLRDAPDVLRASYAWPIQSHGSIGPSCAVADVRPDGGTVWTASQASHRFLNIFRALVDAAARQAARGLPRRRRLLRHERARRCGGRCGAAVQGRRPAGARAMEPRGRTGLGPEGPPQLLDMKATLTPEGRIDAWETDMWVPRATANLE